YDIVNILLGHFPKLTVKTLSLVNHIREPNYDKKVDNYFKKTYNYKRKGASELRSLTPIVT
ncbi:hypothetical protein, partial [Lactobacillus gasseri]|uniref:hypothetical protein n=1 Tax=Lactobacillus gasseri TaxID=1596 RepID=UPI0025502039